MITQEEAFEFGEAWREMLFAKRELDAATETGYVTPTVVERMLRAGDKVDLVANKLCEKLGI